MVDAPTTTIANGYSPVTHRLEETLVKEKKLLEGLALEMCKKRKERKTKNWDRRVGKEESRE